jgi:hypothetical protein
MTWRRTSRSRFLMLVETELPSLEKTTGASCVRRFLNGVNRLMGNYIYRVD